MAFSVTLSDILSLRADAVVLPLEMTMSVVGGPAGDALAAAGGEALKGEIERLRFVSVGRAAKLAPGALPFGHVVAVAVPRWLTGKANELQMLRLCYKSVFSLCASLGCRSVVTPLLSALYYRFPPAEAVHIALDEAGRSPLEVIFAAETPELFEQCSKEYRRPEIVSYVGYYRDSAVFLLDNGQYLRVDLRPELRSFDIVPYIEACFREGTDPTQPPLGEDEKARLREIYENAEC